MIIYAYKTINTINNKVYYGIHKDRSNTKDSYIGCGIYRQSDAKSSTYFHSAVRKHGYENFKVEIITMFETYEDALKWEESFVTQKLVDSENCYNSKIGGIGGGQKWSIEQRNKVKQEGRYNKSTETKIKLSHAAKKRFQTEHGTFYGKQHSDETKKLLSAVRKGRVGCNAGKRLNLTDEQREQIKERLNARRHLIKIPKKFNTETEQLIIAEYKGRGDKVRLSKKYGCSIGIITRLVGKSFTHE